MTLCIIQKDSQVLLGMKKRGFGEGRWNGFGGKVELGESIEAAAKREILEEAYIEAHDLVELGVIDFTFEDNADELEVHIFKCTSFEGVIGESEEMLPKWFFVDEIPYETMWKDDIFWMPLFLQNKKFKGRFLFDVQHEVVENELREVSTLS